MAGLLALVATMSSGLPVLAENAPDTYVVQPGDTLSGIAQMAGISVERLVELNGLPSPDTIFAGETLVLAEPTPVRLVYRVQPGDTLSSIARQSGVDVASIVAANSIDDPNAISVGTELVIPNPMPAVAASTPATTPTVTATAATPRPTTAAAPSPRPSATPTSTPVAAARTTASSSAQTTYVVQHGDTLYSIARSLGVAPTTIQAANQLSSPDHIFVGQRLVIPRGSTSTPAGSSPPPASNDVVTLARQSLGAPYLFGGTTPAGFDCSGFVFHVFTRAGKAMPRDIWSQLDSGPHISREQLQPGDLVFFQNTYMEGLSHNGIYVGNGEFINAVDEDSGVATSHLSSPYWAERWYGATRPRAR